MRRNGFKLLIVLLMIMLSSMLVACEKSETKEPVEDEQNATPDPEDETDKKITEPTYGGDIKISIRSPQTLNPIINKDRTIDLLLNLVFEPLFKLGEGQKPEPNLVASYEIAEEGHYILLKLNEGLVWQDNETLTADDILFTIKALQAAENDVVYKKCVSNIARVSKVSDLEVKIYFKQSSIFNQYALVFPIIPEHYYAGNMSLDADVNLKPLGNGMYQFDSYLPNKQVKLARSNSWSKGKPYIDTVTCVITKDPETDLNAFEQNLIDLISPSIYNWQEFAEKEDLRITEYTSYYYDFIGFNFENEILKDLNLRKAIAYGIDRNKINKRVYLEHAFVTDLPLHPNTWFNESKDLQYTFNKDQAQQLLTTSGWQKTEEEPVLKKGTNILKLNLLVNSNDLIKVQVAEEIKAQLEALGFSIEINNVDYNTYSTRLTEGNYDIVLGAWKLSPIPDLSFAFHSMSMEEGYNFIRFSDEQMDLLLQKVYNAYIEEDFIAAYKELNQYIIENLPYYSLFFRNSAVIMDQKISGSLAPNTYNIFKNFESLYINLPTS